MICRIDVSRPPGVSSCRIASGACWRAARSSERTMKSALAGPIAPLIGITTAGRAAAGLRWAGRGDRGAYDEQRREQRGARDPRGQRVTRVAAGRGRRRRRPVTMKVHRGVRAARGRVPSGWRKGPGPMLKD